ncbi:hypothetical protein BDR26DRAFT_915136 [Obelidium mucronatum]|nr:hypothetical protein BDR26DRAFT_915136 [Obelidium mucronatum]
MFIFEQRIAEAAAAPRLAAATALAVFDFDSTLFRSPQPNAALWAPELRGCVTSDCGWFLEPRTLAPPLVPAAPPRDWWDAGVVAAVAAARAAGAVVVVLTGRRHDRFHARIAALCAQALAGAPDLVLLKEAADPRGGGAVAYETTLDFKWAVLQELLRAFPALRSLDIWDDRVRHLDIFAKKLAPLKDAGRLEDFTIHHVVHDDALAKFLPMNLEYDLVMELIGICNARILAATERELAGSSINQQQQQQSLQSSTEKMDALLEVNSPCASPLEAVAPESDFPVSLNDAIDKQNQSLSTTKQLTLKEKRKAAALSRASVTRKSISCFRSLIEVTENVQYTGVMLSPESTQLLLSAIPVPTDAVYSVKAHHVTICMGKAKDDILAPLGGIDATVYMKAVAFGRYKGVVAVKIELDLERNSWGKLELPPRLSKNETPHCTMYVASSSKAKDSNLIVDWEPLDNVLCIDGKIAEHKLYGIKPGPQRDQKPKDVSLGALVKKYHPEAKGRQVGDAVQRIQEWMDKTCMDNSSHNQPEIELFVSNLKISE